MQTNQRKAGRWPVCTGRPRSPGLGHHGSYAGSVERERRSDGLSPVARIALATLILAWTALAGLAVARSVPRPGVLELGRGASSGLWEPFGSIYEDEILDDWAEPYPTEPSSPVPIEGGYEVSGPFSGDPRFVAGHVVIAAGDEFAGFEVASGEHRWTTEGCGYGSWPNSVHGPTADVAVVECGGDLAGIDAETGDILWRVELDSFERMRLSDTVVVLQDDVEIVVRDRRTGAEVGRLSGMGDANAVANDTTVFASNDQVVVGHRISDWTRIWSVAESGSGLAATNDAVYVRTNQHKVLRLDPDNGAQVWEAPRSGRLDWSDVIGFTDTAVVIQASRGSRYLTAFDRADGHIRWTYTPAADDSVAYAVGERAAVASNHTQEKTVVLDGQTGNELLVLDEAVVAAATTGDRVAYVVFGPEGLHLRVIALP
jgi:outer membrane protein assembly factor BamB